MTKKNFYELFIPVENAATDGRLQAFIDIFDDNDLYEVMERDGLSQLAFYIKTKFAEDDLLQASDRIEAVQAVLANPVIIKAFKNERQGIHFNSAPDILTGCLATLPEQCDIDTLDTVFQSEIFQSYLTEEWKEKQPRHEEELTFYSFDNAMQLFATYGFPKIKDSERLRYAESFLLSSDTVYNIYRKDAGACDANLYIPSVLKQLADIHTLDLAEKLLKDARSYLSKDQQKTLAASVFSCLDSIETQKLWADTVWNSLGYIAEPLEYPEQGEGNTTSFLLIHPSAGDYHSGNKEGLTVTADFSVVSNGGLRVSRHVMDIFYSSDDDNEDSAVERAALLKAFSGVVKDTRTPIAYKKLAQQQLRKYEPKPS